MRAKIEEMQQRLESTKVDRSAYTIVGSKRRKILKWLSEDTLPSIAFRHLTPNSIAATTTTTTTTASLHVTPTPTTTTTTTATARMPPSIAGERREIDSNEVREGSVYTVALDGRYVSLQQTKCGVLIEEGGTPKSQVNRHRTYLTGLLSTVSR